MLPVALLPRMPNSLAVMPLPTSLIASVLGWPACGHELDVQAAWR